MKLSLLVWMCTLSCVAFCQSRDYTIHFSKEGKLRNAMLYDAKKGKSTEVRSYPTILFEGSLKMDLTDIELKDSRHLKGLIGLDTILAQSSVPLLKDLDYKIGTELRELLKNYAHDPRLFIYSPTFSYLPFALENKSVAKKTVCQNCPTLASTANPDSLIFKPGDNLTTIDYDIRLMDVDNEIVSKHLAKTWKTYKGIEPRYENYLARIRRSYRNQVDLINDQFMTDSLNYDYFNIDLLRSLIRLQRESKEINKIYEHVLTNNDHWIKSWMWYTGGKIQLNPFNVTTDTTLIVSRIDEQLFELEEELKTWHSALSHDAHKFDLVNRKIAGTSGAVALLKRERENALTLGPKFKVWNQLVSQKDKLLYTGSWQISSNDSIQWMHHYDADKKYESLSIKDSLPDMLSEVDRVIVDIHNVKNGDKINLTSSLADFQPKSPLQLSLEEIEKAFAGNAAVGKGLSQVIGKLAPAIALGNFSLTPRTLPGFLKSQGRRIKVTSELIDCREEVRKVLDTLTFDNKNKSTIIENLVDICAGDNFNENLRKLRYSDRLNFILILYEFFDIKAIDDYRIAINEMNGVKVELDWLLTQTKPVLEIELKADEIPDFKTVVKSPEEKLDITDSKQVTYMLFVNDNKEAELTKKYKKYKQTRFLPTIGLAFVPENRTGTIFDETTGQFKSGNRFDNVEAFVGVKYYFWPKTKPNPVWHAPTTELIKRRHSGYANVIRGNTFVNRLFVTGGLGVRHQFLRNYYLGIGSDIIPGINAHLGANFIFQRRYSLENGKILTEQERPRPYLYFAISFDPGIIASLTKIFIN